MPVGLDRIDILEAAEKITKDPGGAICAKRSGGLWRLYASSDAHKATLSSNKYLRMQNIVTEEYVNVKLYIQNPFTMRGKDGEVIPGTRLTIDGLPLSVSNDDLASSLEKLGVKTRTNLVWEKLRKRDGTIHPYWITGRRSLFMDLPNAPLGHTIKVGSFSGTLFYKEQGKPDVFCFKCGKKGHVQSKCTAGSQSSELSSAADSDVGDGSKDHGTPSAHGALHVSAPAIDNEPQEEVAHAGQTTDQTYCQQTSNENNDNKKMSDSSTLAKEQNVSTSVTVETHAQTNESPTEQASKKVVASLNGDAKKQQSENSSHAQTENVNAPGEIPHQTIYFSTGSSSEMFEDSLNGNSSNIPEADPAQKEIINLPGEIPDQTILADDPTRLSSEMVDDPPNGNSSNISENDLANINTPRGENVPSTEDLNGPGVREDNDVSDGSDKESSSSELEASKKKKKRKNKKKRGKGKTETNAKLLQTKINQYSSPMAGQDAGSESSSKRHRGMLSPETEVTGQTGNLEKVIKR